jgi:hypothetical protein
MSILQKRSLVAGTLPTTASLLVGELGINVPDGRIFLRKSGSTDTIQSAITTGAQNSGSVTLSGSLALYGTSGSVLSVASDTLEFNGDQMEFTGSFSVSGSTTLIGRLTANDITGSLFGTASRAISSSYALSSSYSTNGFPFSGSAIITGSLAVSGSVNVLNNEFSVQSTGVNLGNIITDTHTITGSFSVSGSINIDGGTY